MQPPSREGLGESVLPEAPQVADSFDVPPDLWRVTHALTPEDGAVVAAMRAASAPLKGRVGEGAAARAAYDDLTGRVAPADGVTYEPETVGGVPGWWCRAADVPRAPETAAAVLYLHSGAYVRGSAGAYRPLAGQLAARVGAAVFVADYRLAPEHPFPAALDDAAACYRAFAARGVRRIALAGDSAGGGLALALLALATAEPPHAALTGAAVFSPWTDLALTGASWEARADAELYFTRPQMHGLARAYLGDYDPADPFASPLYTPAAALAGLPPVRVHVGEDEVLLDDALGYVARAAAAGADARVDVWRGMPHVFVNGVGRLGAAARALDTAGAFLAGRLAEAPVPSA